MMHYDYYTCQSCGISLRKHEHKRGTEHDGTASDKYCNDCYENGRFTHPDWSVAEMEIHLMQKLQKKGLHQFIHNIYAMKIPELERWKKTIYFEINSELPTPHEMTIKPS